jgi:asparagine synthase (glutamine-hydrolysing)
MCGIAGLVVPNCDTLKILHTMNQFQKQRGPDDSGTFIRNSVGLGMTRLAIRDFAGGKQPMTLDENTIVFNGEIFNSEELRKQKLREEDFFSKNSDTELLIRLFIKEGTDCLPLLNGMFSFAVFNEITNQITIVRDRFGIKPLYYFHDGNDFYFSSSIGAIKAILKNQLTINFDAITHFLSIGYIPAPLTIYNEINKLEPGHLLIYDISTSNLIKQKWWTPKHEEINSLDLEKLEFLLKEAMQSWSISDVPLSYMLSGGLDSTTLVSFDGSDKKIGYTLSFPQNLKYWDESIKAKEYADKLNVSQHMVPFKMSREILDDMILAYEQPFSDGFLTYPIFNEISHKFKVCISGTGGDEIFGNYGRAKLLRNFSINRQNFSENYFSKIYGQNDLLKKYIFSQNYNLINSNLSEDYLWEIFYDHYGKSKDLDSAIAFMQIQSQLSNDFLDYTDKFSMNFGVECRTPYLDINLCDYLFSIPSKDRIHDESDKYLLKKFSFARTGVLPAPKKGLNPPISVYLREDLVNFLHPQILENNSLLNLDGIGVFLDKFKLGDDSSLVTIWRLLTLSRWIASEP